MNLSMPEDFEIMDRQAERAATPSWNGIALSSILVLSAVLALTAPALGHKLPCGHIDNSPAKGYNTCSPKVATCTTTGGDPGNCKQMRNFSNLWCECVPKPKSSGGCGSLALYFLSDQGDGPPTAGNGIIYLAESNAQNFVSVVLGLLTWPNFGPEDNGMAGTVTLDFGSFADPAAVPVTISDISMSAPSVFLSGTNFFSLPEGFSQPLVYDSIAGTIDTVDSSGIQIEVTNDHGTEIVPAHLSGEKVDGGFLLNVQLYSPNPLFADGFESGDLSLWSSLGVQALDFFDAFRRRLSWEPPTIFAGRTGSPDSRCSLIAQDPAP